MAILGDDRRGYVVGAVAALAVAAIVREFRTEFRDMGRPLAKATIKSGLTLMDKLREAMAHLSEVVEDLAVEARYELDARHTAPRVPQEPSRGSNSSREVH